MHSCVQLTKRAYSGWDVTAVEHAGNETCMTALCDVIDRAVVVLWSGSEADRPAAAHHRLRPLRLRA